MPPLPRRFPADMHRRPQAWGPESHQLGQSPRSSSRERHARVCNPARELHGATGTGDNPAPCQAAHRSRAPPQAAVGSAQRHHRTTETQKRSQARSRQAAPLTDRGAPTSQARAEEVAQAERHAPPSSTGRQLSCTGRNSFSFRKLSMNLKSLTGPCLELGSNPLPQGTPTLFVGC